MTAQPGVLAPATPGAEPSALGSTTERTVARGLAWAGAAALALPTLYHLATDAWATEEGSYGLIVLAIAIWLVVRRWPKMWAQRQPGHAIGGGLMLAMALIVYVVARIVSYTPLEVASLYATGLAALYLTVGTRGMLTAAFPLAYFVLAIPAPAQLVEITTTHLRLAITDGAVRVLAKAGLMIASEGLDIYIDQYRIAVAQACSGINSMISLTAIGLFYVYARGRQLSPLTAPFVVASILICAAAGNFARVLGIVLLTHFFGEAVAQGPLHETAGLVTFAVALGGVMLLDRAVLRFLPTGHPFDD